MQPGISVFFLCHIAYVHAIQCARTQDEWDRASASLQCQKPNFYHCLKDENGILIQQCLQRVWIQNGMCPEFNSRVGRIDVFQCQSDENNCPNTIFWSNAVYIYPVCYNAAVPKTTPTIKPSATFTSSKEPQTPGNATSDNVNKKNQTTIYAIAISVGVVIIAAVACLIIYVIIKRNRRENEDDIEINVSQSIQSGHRSGMDEERKLIDKTNTDVDPKGNRTKQSEQTRNIKGKTNLIDKTQHHSHTQHSDHERENTEREQLIGDLTPKKEIYGTHILILVLRNVDLNENTVKEEAQKELKVGVDMENNFQKWKHNKTEESYVFRDWIKSDGDINVDELSKTKLEIQRAVENHKTKFVVLFPFKVWTEYKILNEMESWKICRKKTINPPLT